MSFHIFNININGIYYKLEGIYNDSEFEKVMEDINWKLPYNMTVFHYENYNEVDGEPQPNNRVMIDRPEYKAKAEDIFNGNISVKMKLKDKIYKTYHKVIKKFGELVIVEKPDDYPKLYCLSDDKFFLETEFEIRPLHWDEAKTFVNQYHRHCVAPQGHKFSIGLMVEQELIGVVIASQPKAKALNDGYTLEINRCCVNSLYFNACSKMYAHAIKTGKCMGYRRFITYTLPEESGSSIKAVGFQFDGYTEEAPNGWNVPSRPRKVPDKYPKSKKLRWILKVS